MRAYGILYSTLCTVLSGILLLGRCAQYMLQQTPFLWFQLHARHVVGAPAGYPAIPVVHACVPGDEGGNLSWGVWF